MRKNIAQIFLFCCAVALSFALVGCGGGDKFSPTAPTDQSVSGVAAAGAPLNGTVTLKDSSVPYKIRTTVTGSDGSYSFNVNGLQPPYILKVQWKDENAVTLRLHSLTKQHGKANINPLSDVIVAGAAGADDPTVVFDSNDPAVIEAAAEKLMSAIESLRTVLAPMYQLYHIDKDPISDDFTADHTGLDALFDDVRIYAASGMIIVRNKHTNGLIFSAPINNIASGTFYENNLPVQPGSLDGAALYTSKCAGCHGILAESAKRGATAAEIQAAIQSNAGGMGSLSSLTALEIQTIATALEVMMPPTPTACTYTYSAWDACLSDGTQTRTVLTSSPAGCTGTPILSQACTYVPPTPADCTYSYGAWGACLSNGTQLRSLLSSSPAGCTGTPVLTQTCTYVPPVTACTSFTYSAWGACQSNNTQIRTVATSSPAGCTGGTPILSQACTYVPPTPVCGSCHAIPPASGRHSRHASLGYTCATCHGTGYSSTTVNTATHANGVRDVVSSLNWNATTSTCGTPGCHGSRTW